MNKYIIVRTSFGKNQDAQSLAKKLITQKLCACAQISKVESFYLWNNEIQNDDEFLLEIKTKSSLLEDVKFMILSNNEYDSPQIITLEFEAYDKYKLWLNKSLISHKQY